MQTPVTDDAFREFFFFPELEKSVLFTSAQCLQQMVKQCLN